MIFGSGVDLVEVKRIEQILVRWGGKFLQKVFTPEEIRDVQGRKYPALHLAARFAAKEAVSKALSGVWPPGRINWQDVEIRNEPDGRPRVFLRGKIQDKLKENSLSLLLSISHTRSNALASVLLVGVEERRADGDIVEWK